jgi:hypothetical protein
LVITGAEGAAGAAGAIGSAAATGAATAGTASNVSFIFLRISLAFIVIYISFKRMFELQIHLCE